MSAKCMKFTFENLGPIDRANLKLGDLTVIACRNNTGKTYLAHTIYGFLKELLQSSVFGRREQCCLETIIFRQAP